jgi:hypothetical protein
LKARLCGRRIEEHGIVLVGQRRIEIGGPSFHGKALGQRLDLRRIAPNENGIRHHAIAVLELHAALIADRDDRADQMLVEPHAAGDPVHDHAEALRRHIVCSLAIFASGSASGASADQSG